VTLDKLRFARACATLDVPAIPTTLEPHGDGPFVVKERFGAGSRSIGLRLQRQEALAHAAGLQHPIFQPYVAGTEISVDAWCDRHGGVKGLVLRTRDCVVDGESKVTTTFRRPELERRLAGLIERLTLRGPVVMQAILGDDGSLHVVEVNARFGGASTASLRVGLDAWYWTLLEADGGDLSGHSFHRAEFDVRQVRIPADLHQIQGA
jgi:carbamoyl-phosphate synthase large subunit